jgi:tRNA pseudouridine55 synthase
VFLIDKPVGPSSFKMVQGVRRALSLKKVGHSGTLDPFASGLLIICAGRVATKIIPRLMAGDKKYEATLKLGFESDTFDSEGTIVETGSAAAIDHARLQGCLEKFRGEQEQTPPRFSALKHKGKPLYYYARKGIIIEKEPRRIVIRDISCTSCSEGEAIIKVCCGKGTYIRTLASDIGKELGCGAYLTGLRRIANGPFLVDDALPGELLNGEKSTAKEKLMEYVLTVEQALDRIDNNK